MARLKYPLPTLQKKGEECDKRYHRVNGTACAEVSMSLGGSDPLYGQKMIGLSMGSRMTKDLVIGALEEAYRRSGRPSGTIVHSDRGSQYCSNEYRKKLEEYGLVCSMSRKGNCWDNAPMETFWGKMKYEWLHEWRFRTREKAGPQCSSMWSFFTIGAACTSATGT